MVQAKEPPQIQKLPYQALINVLTKTFVPKFKCQRLGATPNNINCGLFKLRRISRGFCELIDNFLATEAGGPMLMAAVRRCLYRTIRLDHLECTRYYTEDLRNRLLDIISESTKATRDIMCEALHEEATKLKNAPALRARLLMAANSGRDFQHVHAQVHAIGEAIDGINDCQHHAHMKITSRWVAEFMIGSICHASSNTLSAVQCVIAWAGGKANMNPWHVPDQLRRVPDQLRRYCTIWLTATQQPNVPVWHELKAKLYDISRTTCSSPDCIWAPPSAS
jgi:hypothetical protein